MHHRPTTITLAARACPHAVTLYEQGAPRDRRIFHAGTACHEYLRALVDGDDLDALFRTLVSTGRTGEDAEGPLDMDSVARGWDLARAWDRVHPIPDGAEAEVPLAMDAEGRPCAYDVGHVRTRIDLIAPWYDEDEDLEGVRVMDYKTAWTAETQLDTMQRRIQAVLAWDAYPDADCIRLEIGAVRTRKIHARTLYREHDQDVIDAWRHDVLQAAAALSETRTPSPGAACLSCEYAHACTHAWDLATDEDADPVLRWAAAEGVRAAVAPLAREATKHEPRHGIGHYPQTSPAPDETTPGTVMDFWTARTGIALPAEYRDALEGLVGALKIGATQVKGIASALTPRGKGGKVARDEFIAAALPAAKISKRWGKLK
jgi:hypothetical protein